MRNSVFAIITAVLSLCGVVGAQLANGGFEEEPNALVFWQPLGHTPQILQSYDAYDRETLIVTLVPFEGENFVLLQCGGGTYDTGYGELTQQISVGAGQTISGAFFFDASDYLPYDDFATITLIPDDPCSGLSEILLATKSISDVNSYGTMRDWETFSYTFDVNEGGNYTLVLMVEDAIDVIYASYLAVDGLAITGEPLCLFNLAGDVDANCRVDFTDYAILTEQDIEISAILPLLNNWLVDCKSDPLNPACIP